VKRLVLFDIDGTLLSAGRVSRSALTQALAKTFGTTGDMAAYDFSGKTDPQIVLDLMRGAGLGESRVREGLEECLGVYTKTLAEEISPENVEPKPGVADLLERLQGEPSVYLGLLTGNLEPCARLKLGPLSFNRFFPFGAFGSDHEDRYRLPRLAVERAFHQTGLRFEGKSIVVVGDSIHDVRCGRDLSVCSVAVTTGRTSAEVLARESPDVLLPDLTEAFSSIVAS
jgi:phosphoglycolate phosphatase-like HAD superfamily hydrolase